MTSRNQLSPNSFSLFFVSISKFCPLTRKFLGMNICVSQQYVLLLLWLLFLLKYVYYLLRTNLEMFWTLFFYLLCLFHFTDPFFFFVQCAVKCFQWILYLRCWILCFYYYICFSFGESIIPLNFFTLPILFIFTWNLLKNFNVLDW